MIFDDYEERGIDDVDKPDAEYLDPDDTVAGIVGDDGREVMRDTYELDQLLEESDEQTQEYDHDGY